MQFLNKYISLTPTEFEVVGDRLFGVPECIAEALDIDIEIVEAITIHDQTKNRVCLFVPQGSYEALADAIEGCTYLARSKDAVVFCGLPVSRLHRLRRAAKTAAQKIRDAGIECGEAPIY